jgi:hypothetical protein
MSRLWNSSGSPFEMKNNASYAVTLGYEVYGISFTGGDMMNTWYNDYPTYWAVTVSPLEFMWTNIQGAAALTAGALATVLAATV